MFTLKGVTYRYPAHKRAALTDISLSVQVGEVVLLAGPNGGGKSTLLKVLTGIIPRGYGGEFTGDALFEDRAVSELIIKDLAGQIGIVLQDPERQITHMTAIEEMVFGPANLLLSKPEVISRAEQALITVGMSHMKSAEILSLSGGELQRLSIASILAMHPQVLVLDEPVTSLDPFGVKMVADTLVSLRKYVKSIIIASHWIDPFIDLVTRIVLVSEGKVVGDIPANEIDSHQKLFTTHSVELPERIRLAGVYKSIQQMNNPRIQIRDNEPRQEVNREEILSAHNITTGFSNGRVLLQHLDVSLHRDVKYVLAGRNGSGKSTLARVLLGLQKHESGQLTLSYKMLGYAPQKPSLSFLGNTVLEEMSFGINTEDDRIIETLELFGLSRYADLSPHILSGGLQRRLSLAVNFVRNPDFLILDEPTAGLDAQGVSDFLKVLSNFKGTVVHITHDMRVVAQTDTHLLVLSEQSLYDIGDRSHIDSTHAERLGYHLTSETVALACHYATVGIPLRPEEMEVLDANRI